MSLLPLVIHRPLQGISAKQSNFTCIHSINIMARRFRSRGLLCLQTFKKLFQEKFKSEDKEEAKLTNIKVGLIGAGMVGKLLLNSILTFKSSLILFSSLSFSLLLSLSRTHNTHNPCQINSPSINSLCVVKRISFEKKSKNQRDKQTQLNAFSLLLYVTPNIFFVQIAPSTIRIYLCQREGLKN